MAESHLQISVLHRPCNWMQGWEGEMDTVHAAFLHSGASFSEDYEPLFTAPEPVAETPVLSWEVHMTTKLRLRVSAMLPSGLGKPPETRARYGWMG